MDHTALLQCRPYSHISLNARDRYPYVIFPYGFRLILLANTSSCPASVDGFLSVIGCLKRPSSKQV